MFALTVALVVTAALSLAFANTRRFAIAAMALLALMYPKLAVVLLLIGGIAAAFIYLTKEKS
jgi:hypothetical protein